MATRLARIADDLARLPTTAMRKASREIVDAAEDEARRATGDGRMSGMGRRGPKLRAVAKVQTRTKSATAEIRGVPAGPWAILQSGARAHRIAPRRRGGVLVGRSMLHPVSGPVRHPGSRAKRTWTRVIEQAREITLEATQAEVRKAVR